MSELSPQPAPDFSDPLGLLRACHRHILGHCELLEKLANHLDKTGVDADAEKAARRVHHYFSTAAALHHMDEEQDLFPRLIRSSIKLATIIHGLKQDHTRIDAAWRDLAPMLARPRNIGDTEQFIGLVAQFCEQYQNHIKVEEREFLDVAQHLLSSEQLREIGKSMQERRTPAATEF